MDEETAVAKEDKKKEIQKKHQDPVKKCIQEDLL